MLTDSDEFASIAMCENAEVLAKISSCLDVNKSIAADINSRVLRSKLTLHRMAAN